MDVLAEIKALREQLDALEKLAKEPKPEPFTKRPVFGETYYYVGSCSLESTEWTTRSADGSVDDERWKCGNVFNTREDARAANEARITLATLRRQPGRGMYNQGKSTHGILVSDQLTVTPYPSDALMTRSVGRVRFCSMEAAQAAIDAVGKERILELVMWENKQ